jgi:hypothetical protein
LALDPISRRTVSNPQKERPYQFDLLEPMTETPSEVLEYARPFIAKSKWIFARTMPETPHEYVLRRDCYANGYEAEFVQMVKLIREHGYRGRFRKPPGRPITLTYMNVDDHRYWSMGAPVPETILINRARNDDLPSICCTLATATGGKHHALSCRNFEKAA